MALTLKNYNEVLPKEMLLLAKKNTVRECDETEKGHFIAYVDQQDASYDVSVTVLPDSTIGESSCDCKNGSGFCRHKTALLIQIATGKKVKAPVKLRKKKSRTEILLDEVDSHELKAWLLELFQKNKGIELSFVHRFSNGAKQYSTEDVTKLVNEAVKVTVSNKRNVDATQLKKLEELWNDMLSPVIKRYQLNLMDENAFLNFHTMLEGFISFQSKIEINSVKIPKLIEGLLTDAANGICALNEETVWEAAARFYLNKIFYSTGYYRLHYLEHLKAICDLSNEPRRNKLIALLAKQFSDCETEHLISGRPFTKLMFGLVEKYRLFPQYYGIFSPIRHDNEFNLRLINLLVENKCFELAEKYCVQQISSNYYEEYNIPYLQILKTMYTAFQEDDKRAGVLARLFPYTFDFDDYLFASKRMSELEQKKWRNNLFSKARAGAEKTKSISVFIFKLMDYEKTYRKMIGYIDAYTPYETILRYFEPMAHADRVGLLQSLVGKTDRIFRVIESDNKSDRASFPQLYEVLIKYYTEDHLRAIIVREEKSRYYSSLNSFFIFVKGKLGR